MAERMRTFVQIKNNCLGIILAGGQSSRMGCDKAYVKLHNKTFYFHMEKLLLDVQLSSICISGKPLGEKSVEDVISNLGPLSGIYSVANSEIAKQYQYLLIVPIDMPLLNVSVIETLLSNINGNDAICYQDHYLPLLIKKDSSFMKQLQWFMYQPSYSLSIKNFLNCLSTKYIKIAQDQQPCFKNINTIDDLKYVTQTMRLEQ